MVRFEKPGEFYQQVIGGTWDVFKCFDGLNFPGSPYFREPKRSNFGPGVLRKLAKWLNLGENLLWVDEIGSY